MAPLARALLLALALAGCGGDDVCLDGCSPTPTPTPGPEDTVTVTGKISELSTFDPTTDVVVIACIDLDPTLTDPTDWNDCPFQRSIAADGDGDFEITRVEDGDLRVGFWISRSATPDGMIQAGDSFAELDDPAGQLLAVEDGETATLSDISVDFAAGSADGDISLGTTATPTPAAASTP